MSMRFLLRTVLDAREGRPLEGGNVLARTAPFLVAGALAFALYPFGTVSYGGEFAATVVLALTLVAAMLLAPWRRLPRFAQVVPPYSFLVLVALLRDSHDGLESGYAPLVLVTVVWFALYGSRVELAASIVGAALTIILPIAIAGDPLYPSDDWRRTFLVSMLAVILGVTIRALVGSLRSALAAQEAAERRLRELQSFELNDDVVQSLAVARIALDLEDNERSRSAIDRALKSAKTTVSALRASSGSGLEPGSFRRSYAPTEKTAAERE